MGHQESIITTKNPKDFNKLVERVKQLGRDYYNGCMCNIPYMVTIKRNMKVMNFPKAWMSNDWESFKPLKGMKFLYVAGDRTLQYDVRNFINKFYPCRSRDEHGTSGGWEEGEHIEFDFEPIMIYSEELPTSFYHNGHSIFKGLDNSLVKVEKFFYDDGDEVEEVIKSIQNVNIEEMFSIIDEITLNVINSNVPRYQCTTLMNTSHLEKIMCKQYPKTRNRNIEIISSIGNKHANVYSCYYSEIKKQFTNTFNEKFNVNAILDEHTLNEILNDLSKKANEILNIFFNQVHMEKYYDALKSTFGKRDIWQEAFDKAFSEYELPDYHEVGKEAFDMALDEHIRVANDFANNFIQKV